MSEYRLEVRGVTKVFPGTRALDQVQLQVRPGEVHALLRQLAESGVGVIVVSSELPEVIGVSDRVAVMHEGCLAGFLEGEEVTEENIMKLASGEQLAEKELRQ